MTVDVVEANPIGSRETAKDWPGVHHRACKKGVVLLVEDDHGDQLLTCEALAASGLAQRVVVVNDGEEALQYIHRQGSHQETARSPRPDLILSDLNMPRMNGRQLVAHLKADTALRPIPIVVLSTSDHPEDIAYCYSIGVNSYVHKPTDFDEFLETIRVIEHYWLRVVRPPVSSPPFSQDAGCEAG